MEDPEKVNGSSRREGLLNDRAIKTRMRGIVNVGKNYFSVRTMQPSKFAGGLAMCPSQRRR
jgi:hypothetical protein